MIVTVTLNTAVDKRYVVEKLLPQTVMRVKQVSNTAGGKGLNVARVAALGGQAVTAMGFVGGYNGSWLESLVTEPGITKAFTHIDAPTRCCVNVWDENTGRSTEFLEPGSPVRQEDAARFLADYEKQLPFADVVVISGSIPQGLPATYYNHLVKLAKQQKKIVLVDTSGPTLENVLQAAPTFIKPNAEEIKQILNINIENRAQLIDAAKQLHQSGISIVAVSLGKEGVLVACEEGVYCGVTPDVPVLNTVGCGDSMVAGFAVGMASGWNIEHVIHYAVSVSTANAMNSTTGYYTQKDLQEIQNMVQITKLE